MRSVQLIERRRLEVRDMPLPPGPGPGEVLVRLRAVGICGSDLHWYLDGRIGPVPAAYPQVLGHEPAGEIVETGPGVRDLRVGQKVAIEPAITCGRCEFCRSGHHNNCVTSIFMGGPQTPGLFREYAVVPERNADAVPERMSFPEITVLEPLAVTLHVLELVDIQIGDTVAVMGAGPVGMLMAAVARLAGASRVFITDRVPHRLQIAEQMGIDAALDTNRVSVRDAVLDLTGGRGVDVVFDAAGACQTLNTGIAMARLGGRVVLIGLPAEPIDLDIHTAMAKELSIQTIKRSNHNTGGAIQLLASGRLPTSFITHRMPLERTPEAFEMLAAYSHGVGKVVIEIP